METATRLAVVALLGLSGASAFAQASFKPPSYIPPFKDGGSLLPGGRQLFGEALAERMKDSAERAGEAASRSAACGAPQQMRIPGSGSTCTDYALGNVSLARFSANYGPIVIVIKKE